MSSSRQQQSGRSESHQSSGFDFICANCGYVNRFEGNNRFERGQFEEEDGPTNQQEARKKPTTPSSSSASYISTTSGDLLRGDYFRLLAKIDTSQSDELIQKVLSIEDRQHIPLELINQGYFSKFFKVLKVLGNGANGKVYQVEHVLLGMSLGVFALKKIAIGDDVDNLVRILNEVKFLYDLSDTAGKAESEPGSGNVVKYNHVWLEIDRVSQFGPQVPVIFILYEYCDGGDLEKFVDSTANPKFDLRKERLRRRLGGLRVRPRFLNNYEIYKIFNDAVNGLNYLHGLKIIHRDLKPSNCLFKSKFPADYEPITSVHQLNRIPTLLVSDFGESIMENTKRNSTGTTGTLEFCAPELFELDDKNRFRDFSHASDVYSLGMILFYLCFNRLPYKSDAPNDIMEEISGSDLFGNMESIREVSHDPDSSALYSSYVSLIREMVNPNPALRPSAAQLVDRMGQIFILLGGLRSSSELSLQPVVNEMVEVPENDDDHEIVALLQKRPLKKSWYTAVGAILLTLANLWCFPDPYITNLGCLCLGLSLTSQAQPYVVLVQLGVTLYEVVKLYRSY